MSIPGRQRGGYEQVACDQAGIVSRVQLRELGVTRARVRADVRARRWRRVYPGVYATFTGPLTDEARLWAALLYAGPEAVAGHASAAWLWGLRADLPDPVVVCVPHGRRGQPTRHGVRVIQARRLSARVHPAGWPTRTTVEDTVLDLVAVARSERVVIDLVLHACQHRLSTPARLSLAARARRRLRWRALVGDLLAEVRDGVASPLERRYLHDVERRHGLPRGERNRAELVAGVLRYRDVRYRPWRLVVELDGLAAHPEDRRELDDLRDNEVAERGERTLRYGWRAITGDPCAVARQVAGVLARGGWTGSPHACGPGCPVGAGGTATDGAPVGR